MRSPVLRSVDDSPIWSLVCLYVAKAARGRGLALDMLRGTVDYVAAQDSEIVEAYTVIPRKGKLPPVSSFMGTPQMYEAVGFVKVSQASESRAIYRSLIHRS